MPRVRITPITMTTTRSVRSFTRSIIRAPITLPSTAPMPVTAAASQRTSPDNRKTSTALAFITPASTFLVAPAVCTAMPARERTAIIRKPIPPPK